IDPVQVSHRMIKQEKDGGRYADRDVDEEHVGPPDAIDQYPADRGADGRGQEQDNAESDGYFSFSGLLAAHEYVHRQRDQGRTEGSLERPAEDEHFERRGQGTRGRSQGKADEADQVDFT